MRYLILYTVIFLLASCGKIDKPQSFKPTFDNSIYDSAKLLSQQEADSLFKLISELNSSVGSQMVIIIVDTLNGQGINEYSLDQAENLEIGRDEYADGILLTIAVKDQKIRIEVGAGLELIIKDEIGARIIRQVIAPKFRKGKYGLGIYKGLDSIKFLIERNKELVGKR